MEYRELFGEARPTVIKAKDITKPNADGYFDYGSKTLLYTVKLSRKQMRDPHGTIDYWFTDHYRCGHDYDCCGCWRWNAYTHTVKHTKRREFVFQYSGHANI